MFEQLNKFDVMQPIKTVPTANEAGCIPAELLEPLRWEAWKYYRVDASLKNSPYIIDACLVVLPGNRLYVKEWMLYPFMYELKSSDAVEKMYHKLRAGIVERIKNNNETYRTWQVYELPTLDDMWMYEEGKYSCWAYAKTHLDGYNIKQNHF